MNFFRCEYRDKNNNPIVDMHYATDFSLALDYCIRDFDRKSSGIYPQLGDQYWIWMETTGYNQDPVKIGEFFLPTGTDAFLFDVGDECPDMLNVAAIVCQNKITVKLRPRGRSMEPLIKDGQEVVIKPFGKDSPRVGQPVLCRVGRKTFLHKVVEITEEGYVISNNKGFVNGVASAIYGCVV